MPTGGGIAGRGQVQDRFDVVERWVGPVPKAGRWGAFRDQLDAPSGGICTAQAAQHKNHSAW